jgi:hypothetical protein
MRRITLLLATLSLFGGGTALVVTSVASASPASAAKKKKKGKCHCKTGPRGATGPAGAAGATGPAGPAGATGPAGTGVGPTSGSVTPFNMNVPPNGVESITVGQFNLRQNNGPTGCAAVQLFNNSTIDAFTGLGENAAFAAGPGHTGATPKTVIAAHAGALTGTANRLFAAFLVNGTSQVNGNVSDFVLSGAVGCATTGFMQGA